MKNIAKRRTEISVETHEIKSIRISSGEMNSAYCEQCGLQTRFFTPAEIVSIFQITNDQFERRLGNGELHLVENGENLPRVCGMFTETKTNFVKGLLND